MEHHFEVIDGRKNWILTDADIDCLKEGCGILGAGGGASPYLTSLVCKNFLKNGYKLRVIAVEDMQEDEYGLCGAFLGAPTVGIEKICTGNEIKEAVDCILQLKENKDKKMAGFISCEIGGMNSVAPLYSAA